MTEGDTTNPDTPAHHTLPSLGPMGCVWRSLKGKQGPVRSPARPSLPPGLQLVQHQCRLGLGFLQEAGDALADLTDTGAPSPPQARHQPRWPHLPATSLGCPLWVTPSP